MRTTKRQQRRAAIIGAAIPRIKKRWRKQKEKFVADLKKWYI